MPSIQTHRKSKKHVLATSLKIDLYFRWIARNFSLAYGMMISVIDIKTKSVCSTSLSIMDGGTPHPSCKLINDVLVFLRDTHLIK